MKLSNLFCVILSLLSANVATAAYKYDLRCQDKKMVWLNAGEKPPPSSECQTFLQNGFAKCYDTHKAATSSQTMTISAPNDQYYKNKESNKYDRKAIQEIIQSAARFGNDPYLALSLVLIENPPLVDGADDIYTSFYGQIPIDKIGVADVFNCDSQMESFDSKKSIRTYINKEKELREFNIEPRAPQKIICLAPGVRAGSAATFGIAQAPNDKYCCAKIRTNLNMRTQDPATLQRIRSYLANVYIKKRFETGAKRAGQIDTAAEKMAMIAQAYNGYGTFGASEKMANQCLTGVNMRKTPVYGAGVSETMLNSVMNNSEIKKMVDDATRAAGAKPSSYLCEAYGNGDHKISGYAFTGLLKEYVGTRRNCPRHTYALKGSSVGATQTLGSSGSDASGGSADKKSKGVKTGN
ncbi:MAG: hypothetical protein V4654_08420 [Bdellovibrionota bacterium]